MTRSPRKLQIYTVVDVWRGMAVGAKSFSDSKNAQKYMRRLRQRRSLMEDDVQLFENSIRISLRTDSEAP